MNARTRPVLRNYQIDYRDALRAAIGSGYRRPIGVAPTGAGKRISIIDISMAAVERGWDVMNLCERRMLVEQLVQGYHEYGVPCGIIMDGYEENRIPHIQVVSLQTYMARYVGTMKEAERPRPRLICLDEGHKDVGRNKELLALHPEAIALIITATPVGANGTSLIQEGYADVMTEVITNSQLIKAGYLLPTTVIAPSEPNIEGVKIVKREEYAPLQLERQVQEVTCFADVFNEWAPFADRKTIVFTPGIAYCNGLMGGPGVSGDHFYGRGIRAAVLTSKVKPKDRDAIWKDFKEGDLRVLLTVDMLREGVDVPAASCAIDLQPNAQLRTYWQKIGRIKRPYPGQTHAVYIDMAGNYWRFPHPDEDPDWASVTDKLSTQDVLKQARLKGTAQRQTRCPKCGTTRSGGARCLSCGYEASPSEIVRRIRMGNGKLKVVTAKEKDKVEKTDEQRRRESWKSMLFAGLRSNKTLAQCRWMFKQKHGDWPAYDYPCCPDEGSARWSMRVAQVYDPRAIMTSFSRRQSEPGSGERFF